jgi:cyclohexadieny/prephenate dehydrogenase
VPVGACGPVAEAIGPVLKRGRHRHRRRLGQAVGGARVAPAHADGRRSHPGHPIAGTEHSGPDAGFAELFDNRWCILTPPEGADPEAVERLERFWRACGAKSRFMTPEHHDLVLAITSHLPHLIAYNIVGTAADLEEVTSPR